MNYFIAAIQTILLVILSIPILYLLGLMVAAGFYRRQPLKPISKQSSNFVILIPAHNEALTIPATLETIKTLRADSDAPTPLIVVVADNCTDNTAEIARQAGVLVLERQDELKGKGHALEWAIKKLLTHFGPERFNALVIFDADTMPDQNFLKEAQRAMQTGGTILQGCYDILNPGESWRTRLLYTAFVIYNHIRPLGKSSLKLSDGLRGNGMVLSRNVLEQVPWQAFSIVEDIEYTNRLVLAGYTIMYIPEARIYGQAPSGRKAAATQRMRWEGGRFRQAKHDLLPLLKHAFTRGSFKAFDRAMDLIIPPLALLALWLIGLTGLDILCWFWLGGEWLGATTLGWLILLAGLGLFVLGGLIIARTPLSAYLALLFAPFYILWKLEIYAKLLVQRAPINWERTPRTKIELTEAQSQQLGEKVRPPC